MASVTPDVSLRWQDLPVVRDAGRALLAHFTAWQQLPARIEAAGHQALVIENAAAQQSQGAVQAAIQTVTKTLADLQQTFWTTSPKVGQVVAALSQEGGGAPLDVVASAVDVWATMEQSLTAMDGVEQAIAAAAPLVLSPNEVAALQISAPAGSSVGSGHLLWYGVAGLAVLLLFGKRRRG